MLLVLLLMGVVGCSTVDSRIASNPAVWEALSEEQQEQIREGRIYPGMTKEAAYLAFGSPQRVNEGMSDGVAYVEWVYTQTRSREVPDWEYRRVRRGDTIGVESVYSPIRVSEVEPYRSIRFVDGVVVEWKQPRRR